MRVLQPEASHGRFCYLHHDSTSVTEQDHTKPCAEDHKKKSDISCTLR